MPGLDDEKETCEGNRWDYRVDEGVDGSTLAQRTATSWLWRFGFASLSYLPIYYTFGMTGRWKQGWQP